MRAYGDLPVDESGRRRAWDHGAEVDQVGLLRLQTPERVVAAAKLIRSGVVYSLNAPLDLLDPPLFGRAGYRHTVLEGGNGFDDRIDGFFPQSSTQWDSLGHVAYTRGVYYGGASSEEVSTGRRNTVDAWARRGIAGRAVMWDLAGYLHREDPDYDPVSSRAITVKELQQMQVDAGVDIRPGDIALLHTGWLERYEHLSTTDRQNLARDRQAVRAAGLEHTEGMARYLWDLQIAGIGCDSPTVEVWPPDESASATPFGFLHRILIGGFGMALGELWWLADLAAACRADGRNEFFLTSAPLHVSGGIGAPANALAIK